MAKKKEYVFTFEGTKEAFLKNLEQYHEGGFHYKIYYMEDFLVKVIGDEIHFGPERGGHSHGYWYIPEITETDSGLEFRGTIQYLGPESKSKYPALRKTLDAIDNVVMFVVLLPIAMIVRVYRLFDWCVRKIRNNPKPKKKTTEDRLIDLMENYMGCAEKKA